MARPRNNDQDENSAAEPPRTRKTTSAKKSTTAKKSATAKKSTTAKTSTTAKKSSAAKSAAATSPAREPTHDEIAFRAYEISQGPDAGSDEENWHRAARELRGDKPDPGGPWAKIGSGDTESMTSD